MPLTEPQAKVVWHLLSAHATRPFETEARAAFVWHITHGCKDYSLPSGAKLYVERQGLRIAFHRDDETLERLVAIKETNARLAELWETWNGE